MSRNYMKLRQDFIAICKDRALKRMTRLLDKKHSNFNSCSYTALREIYALSEFTILNSHWPGFLLGKAKKLDLLYIDEFPILYPSVNEEDFDLLQSEVDKVFGRKIK